jgi:hypothetical protein
MAGRGETGLVGCVCGCAAGRGPLPWATSWPPTDGPSRTPSRESGGADRFPDPTDTRSRWRGRRAGFDAPEPMAGPGDPGGARGGRSPTGGGPSQPTGGPGRFAGSDGGRGPSIAPARRRAGSAGLDRPGPSGIRPARGRTSQPITTVAITSLVGAGAALDRIGVVTRRSSGSARLTHRGFSRSQRRRTWFISRSPRPWPQCRPRGGRSAVAGSRKFVRGTNDPAS